MRAEEKVKVGQGENFVSREDNGATVIVDEMDDLGVGRVVLKCDASEPQTDFHEEVVVLAEESLRKLYV